jgi:hypothetical protein
MKLIIAGVLFGLSFGSAFALDNATQAWSRCKLDCDNAGGEPIVIKECKKRCDETATTTRLKDKKGTLKALDPNLPELTPDN